MENKKSNSSLKAIIIVLSILLVGSLVVMYNMSTNSEKTEKKLLTEKDQLIQDLETAKANYDLAIADNSGLKEELVAERAKIEDLLAKVKQSEGDVKSLQRYKNDYRRLKRDMDVLIAENKQLKEQNGMLTSQRDSTMTALGEAKSYNDTLVSQNENLSKTVEKASRVQVLNLKTQSYKERNSGKLVATERARRVDVLKISFTLAANEVAKSGNKMYYIQVIDSKNNVVGEKKTEVFNDKSLTYSFITNAAYQNKTMEVSETIPGQDFEKGLYTVNVFDKDQMVGNTTFTLK